MTIEDQIQDLLKQAEPLRHVPEDDPLANKLRDIVDQINALRAKQAKEPVTAVAATVEGSEAKKK